MRSISEQTHAHVSVDGKHVRTPSYVHKGA